MSSNTVEVTIIIPTYNDVDGLRDTLNALLPQVTSDDPVEVIIADNASTDNTKQLFEEYAAKFPSGCLRYLYVEKPGSYSARNAAVAVSNGKNLLFTDAGCVPSATWLKAAVSFLDGKELAYGVGPVEYTFTPGGPNIAELVDSQRSLYQEWHVLSHWGVTANAFVTRSAFDLAKGFREDFYSTADRIFGATLYTHGVVAELVPAASVSHDARSTWGSLRKRRRRIAAGMAQRELSDVNELLAKVDGYSGPMPPRIFPVPKPKPHQIPGFMLLKLICKVECDMVYRKTLKEGKVGLGFRS